MTTDLEHRIAELEAQVRALTNLVLSDIASTTPDGLRDIVGMIIMAEGQATPAASPQDARMTIALDDMIGDIRSVLAASRDGGDE